MCTTETTRAPEATESAESAELAAGLRSAARDAGIDLLGFTSAEPFELREEWGVDQPRELLPAGRSVVVAGFAVRYEPRPVPSEPGTPRGRFPAFGSRVFEQMERHCWDVVGGYLRRRGFAAVEAAYIPIKPAVVRAGLGRYGRHAVVITPELGSMVMFACMVTDAPLATPADDAPVYAETCPEGCRLCVDACPTGALAGDYKLDRARCITNWLWGADIPAELRPEQQNRLFGCGECLFACPRNSGVAARAAYPVPTDPFDDGPELIPLAAGDRAFYDLSVPTFARRAGFDVMRASAVVALGNVGDPAAMETLGGVLLGADEGAAADARLRGYAAWSLGRLGIERARELLAEAREAEGDAGVVAEIEAAQIVR
jgi:epoxyqueuosine reductase